MNAEILVLVICVEVIIHYIICMTVPLTDVVLRTFRIMRAANFFFLDLIQ